MPDSYKHYIGKTLMYMEVDQKGVPHDVRRECMKCDECGVILMISLKEYVIDAWAKKKWLCGNCGTVIDPLGLIRST